MDTLELHPIAKCNVGHEQTVQIIYSARRSVREARPSDRTRAFTILALLFYIS